MHNEQRQRAARRLAQDGIEQALFASPLSVRWLTGLDVPGGSAENPALIWYDRGDFTLLVEDSFAAQAASFAHEPGCTLVDYLATRSSSPSTGPAIWPGSWAKWPSAVWRTRMSSASKPRASPCICGGQCAVCCPAATT